MEWRWNEPQTPAAAEALVYDPAVRSRMDQAVLRWSRPATPAAARELAKRQPVAGGRPVRTPAQIFWKICAGYFEAMALGLLPPICT